MSGFSDPIVGGIGTLIRQYIESANFVSGSTGWRISQDGSAEFNNAVFRGSIVIESSSQGIFAYAGTPQAGNLVAAISPQAGTDAYGNNYGIGLTLPAISAGTSYTNGDIGFYDKDSHILDQALINYRNDGSSNANLTIQGSSAGVGIGANLLLANEYLSQFTQAVLQANQIIFQPSQSLQLTPNDLAGLSYYEEMGIFSQSISGGSNNIISNLGQNYFYSDYPSGFSGPVWTPPISGIYSITFSLSYSVTSNSRIIMQIIDLSSNTWGRLDITTPTGTTDETLTVTRYFSASTGYRFSFYSSTSGSINSGTSSYIAIRRCL